MKPLSVVKVGGNVLEDTHKCDRFLKAFVALPGQKILVHGGGKLATQLAGRLGVATRMLEGRRITDDDMLEIVVMSYAGLINKQLVSALYAHGTSAIGMTGADGNALLAKKRAVQKGIDYGWVGDPVEVNTDLLDVLLASAGVPVIAPITHDGGGQLLNTNADTIASVVATAMSVRYEVVLNYCFELPGVLTDKNDPKTLIASLDTSRYAEVRSQGLVSDGMIPKLDNAFDALGRGVSEVRILKYDGLNSATHEYTRIHL